MFFALSKIVYWLVMPTSLIAWSAISIIFVKKERPKKRLRLLTISLFLFFTNPFVATVVINIWEPKATSYQQIDGQYDYGIVLSGITNPNRPPFDRVQFNKGADRIVHAVDLYKLGKIKKILITGGSGTLTFEGKKEADGLKDFALNCGIPENDILVENQARSTRENALFSKALITERDKKSILITSAFHMIRAKRCFEKTGLDIIPFSTDHYGRPLRYTPDDMIIPSLYGLKIWTILFKEWIGLIAYKFAGYI